MDIAERVAKEINAQRAAVQSSPAEISDPPQLKAGITDSEKKLLRVQLQIDLEDAQSDLAYLREKAIRTGNVLSTLADLINRVGVFDSSNSFESMANGAIGSDWSESVNLDVLRSLAEELMAAKSKVDELTIRKKNLGVF